jgi:hypothetical protein
LARRGGMGSIKAEALPLRCALAHIVRDISRTPSAGRGALPPRRRRRWAIARDALVSPNNRLSTRGADDFVSPRKKEAQDDQQIRRAGIGTDIEAAAQIADHHSKDFGVAAMLAE